VVTASLTSEIFGMALAEAMACGRAVLASSWRGFDDVVIAGKAGERFSAGNPRELADAMRRLLKDDERRAGYAAAGRRRVLDLFRWEIVAACVQAVYDRTLGRNGRARP
jgi:glycosyltransferase involved in cell wall biosynthesis